MTISGDRKRKRGSGSNGVSGVKTAEIKVGAQLQQPPVLASVHGVKLSHDLNFSAYHRQKPKAGNHALKDEVVLHGENDRMEYDAAELDDSRGLSHYVGIYDPATNTVEVYPAPLLHLTAQVKAIKDKEIPDRIEETDYMTSRHALGSAFGTKKSRKKLLDRELNAVTAASLGNTASADVTEVITSAVQEAVASMGERKESEQSAAEVGNRKYVPKPRTAEGTLPKEIYKLGDLVSDKELGLCDLYEWEEGMKQGKKDISTASPSYINPRIPPLIKEGNNDRLRILRYIEHIICFYKFMSSKRDSALRRIIIAGVPSDDRRITEGLIERYTEAVNQASDNRTLSKPLKTKLFCYMVLLCLKLETNSTMDIFDLVQDLQVDRRDMEQVCREVGAKVKPLTDAQIVALGLSKAEASEHRFCQLSLPLVFPKEKRFMRKR